MYAKNVWSAHDARWRLPANSMTRRCLSGRSPHCGFIAGARYDADTAGSYYSEAIDVARASDDRWRLSQLLAWQANTGISTGDPMAAGRAGEEGRAIAEAIGDRANSRHCRVGIGWSLLLQGNVARAISEFSAMTAECEEAHDDVLKPVASMGLSISLAYHGETDASAAVADTALRDAADLGEYFLGMAHAQLAQASLAAGDIVAAHDAAEAGWQEMRVASPNLLSRSVSSIRSKSP